MQLPLGGPIRLSTISRPAYVDLLPCAFFNTLESFGGGEREARSFRTLSKVGEKGDKGTDLRQVLAKATRGCPSPSYTPAARGFPNPVIQLAFGRGALVDSTTLLSMLSWRMVGRLWTGCVNSLRVPSPAGSLL